MLLKQGIWQKIQNFLQPTKQILEDLKNDPNIESVSIQNCGGYDRVVVTRPKQTRNKIITKQEEQQALECFRRCASAGVDATCIIEDEAIVNQFATTSSQLQHFTQQYQDAQLAANANISAEEFCVQIIEYMRELNNTLYDFSKYHKVQI